MWQHRSVRLASSVQARRRRSSTAPGGIFSSIFVSALPSRQHPPHLRIEIEVASILEGNAAAWRTISLITCRLRAPFVYDQVRNPALDVKVGGRRYGQRIRLKKAVYWRNIVLMAIYGWYSCCATSRCLYCRRRDLEGIVILPVARERRWVLSHRLTLKKHFAC